ncbi:nucleoporin NUP42-like [Anastrepha ludens]|uniref:nucleoporin NUP42-like n=1 Tax=Anastrepha ludens TaxID=28586 RepID=UPI0023B0E7A3|nr:nucleoporin NUP42-like [Anastrepha ludens]
MVLCRFFLQGTCRFGTKCSNEHLDIKQLVKTDLEAAINGKQWPFSCFGPFKDKPCIPAFIEDQSFEEIRWLCYEAKQKNCADQYVQQFNKEAMEANNKIKTILQLSPHVIDLICRLYDAPADVGGNSGLEKSNANPFGFRSNITNDATSIFNKSGTPSGSNNTFRGGFSNIATTSSAGNTFSGVTSSPAGGIFAGSSSPFNSQNQQSSIFSHQLPQTNSIFGGGGSQNALFGQPQTSTGVIGGLFGQTSQPTGGFFAQASQQQQNRPSPNVGLFAQQTQQPQSVSNVDLFAKQCQSQSAPIGGVIFNQNIQQQQQSNGNIFAQSIQAQQMQTASGFPLYQTNKQHPPSVFGQQNAFTQQSSNGVFGQMVQNASVSNSNNIFTQPLSATNDNGGFKNPHTSAIPTQNIFAHALQQQQRTPANIFSQPAKPSANISVSMEPSTGFFQHGTQLQQVPHQETAFGQQIVENGSSQPLLQSPVVSSSVYSKLEDLTHEEIESFKAVTFTQGRIPNVPPPRELIN